MLSVFPVPPPLLPCGEMARNTVSHGVTWGVVNLDLIDKSVHSHIVVTVTINWFMLDHWTLINRLLTL